MAPSDRRREPWNTSDVVAVGLEILRYQGTGLHVVEAVGLLIAADARLNIWMLDTAKGSKTREDLFGIVQEVQECRQAMRAAWRSFLDRGIAEHIERHNALSVEERASSGVREDLHRLVGDANADLGTELRRIRDRLLKIIE